MLARSPDAVKALERLQQQERQAAGEAPLSSDPVPDLRWAIEMQLISEDLDRGGLEATINSVGTPERAREVEQRIHDVLHQFHLDDPTQWSQYERPNYAWRIADLCSRIEDVMERHGRRLAEAPVVGTLATGQISAMTQRAPGNEATLILVENGFFTFAHFLAQLSVLTLYDVASRGGFTEPAIQLLSDMVATQTVLNTCLYLYPRGTPESVRPLVEALEDAICLFVLAHEYAHLWSGDLDAHPSTRVGGSHHAQEFRADELGLLTTVEAMRDNGAPGAAMFGPLLFFAGLDVVARASATYEGKPAPAWTDSAYPTPVERAMNLLSTLEKSTLGQVFGEQVGLASRTYHFILSIWDIVLPSFQALRQQLSAFRPGEGGPAMLPEWRAHAVVSTLWQDVLRRLRMQPHPPMAPHS